MGKYKKLIITLSIIAVLLVGYIVAYACAGEYIDNTMRLWFWSDEEYCNMAEDAFLEKLEAGLDGIGVGETFDAAVEYQVKAEADESMTALVGLTGDKSISAKGFVRKAGSEFFGSVLPGINGVDITDVKMIVKPLEKEAYIELPELSDTVIGLNTPFAQAYDSIEDLTAGADISGIARKAAQFIPEVTSKDEMIRAFRDKRKDIKIDKSVTFTVGDLSTEAIEVSYDCDLSGYSAQNCLYLNDKGELLGSRIVIRVNSSKIGLVIRLKETEGFACDYSVELNSLDVLMGSFEAVSSQESGEIKLHLVPGDFIKSFIGNGNYTADITYTSCTPKEDINSIGMQLAVNCDGRQQASLSMSFSQTEGQQKPFNTDSQKSEDIMKLVITDYMNINDLAGFVLEKADAINDPDFYGLLNNYLQRYVDAGLDIDVVREFYNSGILAKLFADEEDTATDDADLPLPLEPQITPEDELMGDGESLPQIQEDSPENKPEEKQPDEDTSPKPPTQGEEDTTMPEQPAGPSEEEIEELKKAFLKEHKYDFPIEDDNPVADWGDEVKMDIVPLIMGKPYADYSYTDAYAYLGEQWYGEGLDEKLIGACVGDVIKVTATLGDDFGAFSGYTGTFRVTVTQIKKFVRPEWTQEFIVDRLGYKSLEACLKEITEKADKS